MTEKRPAERFIRWQGIALEQLGFASNLILTLAVGALGYELIVFRDQPLFPICASKVTLVTLYVFFAAALFSLIFLVTSAGFGLWLVLNRLADFRLTKDIARRDEKRESNPLGEREANELEMDRVRAKRLGKATWWLFCGQVITFAVGTLLTVISVLATVAAKVFGS